MNDSSHPRGFNRTTTNSLSDSLNKTEPKRSVLYTKYNSSALRTQVYGNLTSRFANSSQLSDRSFNSNSMNASYRDNTRTYLKNGNVLSTKTNRKNESEPETPEQYRGVYPTKSDSSTMLSNPVGISRYLSTKPLQTSVTKTRTALTSRHSNSDLMPNGDISKLTLNDSGPHLPPSSAPFRSNPPHSPSVNDTSSSSTESSPEPAHCTTGTSNSSNNSSVPKLTAGSQSSRISEGFSRSSGSGDRRNGGLVGLNNLGNTCFMNSIIQCLSNTQPLLDFCLCGGYTNVLNPNSTMRGSLFSSYVSLMKELWNPDLADSSTSPHQFKTQIQRFAPRFVGYSQQDSQEFLRYVLEGLHNEVNRVHKCPPPINPDYAAEDKMGDREKAEIYWKRYLSIDNSEIVDLFVGQLMSTLECSECGFKSTTFDPFWDLSLPIPKKPSVTIMDCLRLFTSKDDLDGNERPVCARCKTRRRCAKSFSIQKFPRILVLHLKRFSGERFRSKMSLLVDFPISDLNLAEFASPSCQQRRLRYNLYAVSNHSGSVYAGHYTASCRHPYRNSWLEYNDNRVRPISAQSIVSAEAYVLFYEQAD